MKPIDNKKTTLHIAEKTAFKEMYYNFYPILYNYGIKLIQDKEAVKDSIHDLFIKLMLNSKKTSSTVSAEHLKYYIIKSFRNILYDYLRKQKHTDDISNYENDFSANDLFLSLFEEKYASDADTEFLKKNISLLSSRQQEVLYLFFVNDLKHEEIAGILNVNYQSSKNILYRALSKLRRLFETSEYQINK